MPPRPVIGITTDVRLDKRTLQFVFSEYVDCVERAGGLPLHIPALREHCEDIPELLEYYVNLFVNQFIGQKGNDHTAHRRKYIQPMNVRLIYVRSL